MAHETVTKTFDEVLDEHYAVMREIRDLNMGFHTAERYHRLIPGTSAEALEERSRQLDALLERERLIRRELIDMAG